MKLTTNRNAPGGAAASKPEPALTALNRAIDRALLASAGGAFLTAAAAGTLALPAGEVLAATIAIDAGAVDDDNSSGNCSLVEAVRAANTDTAVDACTAGDGADTLVLPSDSEFTFENANDESEGANALPSITSELTVQGNGTVIERSDASGTPEFRLLRVAGSGTLSLDAVTIRNGVASGSAPASNGGAVLSEGTLQLNRSEVNESSADDRGGGIFNSGSVELNQSTISGNLADQGGGLYSAAESTASISNSTIDDNSAYVGGGIYTKATLALHQTTISQNSAGDGGGISSNGGSLTLSHSTLSRNEAGYSGHGGGLYAYANSIVTLSHNIVAGNFAYSGMEISASTSTVSANSHNLFGRDSMLTCDALWGFAPGPTDITATSNGTDPTTINDIIGSLSDHGGPTPTYALVPGSPAIDAGDPDFTPPPDHDQRGPGFPRVVGTMVDIGAYELESRIFVDQFEQ